MEAGIQNEILIRLKNKSFSDEGLILSLKDALQAIDVLERNGIRILGWEALVKKANGNVGMAMHHKAQPAWNN